VKASVIELLQSTRSLLIN